SAGRGGVGSGSGSGTGVGLGCGCGTTFFGCGCMGTGTGSGTGTGAGGVTSTVVVVGCCVATGCGATIFGRFVATAAGFDMKCQVANAPNASTRKMMMTNKPVCLRSFSTTVVRTVVG